MSNYETYEDDGDVRTALFGRGPRPAAARPSQKRRNSYSRHNRPQVFNGIHRRRHKKFTW
jgi:hypothetical protein